MKANDPRAYGEVEFSQCIIPEENMGKIAPEILRRAPAIVASRWIQGEYLLRPPVKLGYKYLGIGLSLSGLFNYKAYTSEGKIKREGIICFTMRKGEIGFVGLRTGEYDASEKWGKSLRKWVSLFSSLHANRESSVLSIAYSLEDVPNDFAAKVKPEEGGPGAASIENLSTLMGDKVFRKTSRPAGMIEINITTLETLITSPDLDQETFRGVYRHISGYEEQ